MKGVNAVRPYTQFGLDALVAIKQKATTVKAVAEHFEISSSYVSDLFAGVRNGKKAIERRKAIAKHLGITYKQ